MRLQRLVVSGFKTFAHRTEIRFGAGITGVVGPNGSGKSNLVDAVRWALGETNARELRGSRLDEMIFAGGTGRDRMGVAEVELILDNEDGLLPVEDAEVALSRRVVRGGDVEYRINGERARLRDLERILGGTGLTQHGYAVVAQHDIEAIIEATPRQRRSLVEQAAGVRPLRVACDDALRRLDLVGTAVQRLVDRLGESEPRLAQLAGEREAALEVRGMAERLASLRGSLAREAWRAARAEVRQARRRLETADRRLEAATEAEEGFATRVDASRASLEATRSAQREAADRLEAARMAAERCRGEARRFADRARTAALHRADARRQYHAAALEVEAAVRALGELAGADREAGERRRDLETAMAGLSAQRREAAAEASGAQRQADDAERDLVRAAAAALAARTGARERAENRDLLDQTVQAAAAELAAAQARTGELETAARAAQGRLARIEATATAAETEAALRAAELEEARRGLREAEGRRVEARERMTAALARAASLRGQVDGLLGGTGAIGARAAELGAVRLVDVIRVLDPGDATAVEAALEPHLGAWVVADVDRALDLLRGAEVREEVLTAGAAAGPGGEGELAAQGDVAGVDGGGPGATGGGAARRALDAVEVEPRARAAAIHCLARTWLVADLATARRVATAAAVRAVLPDGAVITAAGARAGGGSAPTLSLVAAAREAEAAAGSASALEAAAGAEVRRWTGAVAAADQALGRASAELAARRREAAEASAQSAAAGIAAAMESRRLPALEAELNRHVEARTQAAAAAESAELDAERAGRTEEDLRAAAEQARARFTELRDRSDRLTAQLARAEAAVAELRLAVDEADRRRFESERRRSDAAGRLADSDARVAGAETDVLAALAHGGAAAAAALSAEGTVERAAAHLSEMSRPLGEMESALTDLEAERGEVRVAVARAEDEVNAARSEVGVAEMRLAEQAELVRDHVDDDPAELDSAAAERAEREISRLERRIAAMGPVNALAPEQHAALADRVGRLRAGRDDLTVASAEVGNLVRRFEAEAGRRFEAVFGAVNVHFAELFSGLVPGGRAALRLEAPAEPPPAADAEDGQPRRVAADDERLEGVAILAQPAGKRLQHLSLLSGGERALTALAVVLALQQVNPSPFYIFDEVDAPLDDTSVLRFTRLLGRLAALQQFIVVTHNHVTMAAADALYGVTIDREGVSSLLSVRFSADRGVTDVTGTLVAPLRRVAS
ncbi:MAG: chromosome segregation protein SMC [Candidatus Dormibacteria bacterium]